MYKKTVLDNGVRLVLKHIPKMESAAVGVWVSAGSRNEDTKNSGISHFIEHMVFKGTSSRSGRDIKEEIEGRGGSLNAFTSEEMTCYFAKVSGRHVNTALDVLSDIVLNPGMKNKDIERERKVIIEEIKMYRDLPNHRVHDILTELLWPGHSLGFSIAGDIGSVSSITRQDIIDYRKNNYLPLNTAVVLCGNINYKNVIEQTKKIFRLKTEKRPGPLIDFVNKQDRPVSKFSYKDTEQSHLAMGVHTPGKDHEDKYALILLHIILGANMSSRLFENIREKRGLAYEIGSELRKYKDTGAFVINAGIEHGKVKETVSLVMKELRRIRKQLVSAEELNRAKEFFKVQLLMSLEDTMDHMLWVGEKLISSGKVPDKKSIIKKMMSISVDDLRRVGNSIFNNENLNLALIGPVKGSEEKDIEKELVL
jgi:predicted Zn-dependent peptidase